MRRQVSRLIVNTHSASSLPPKIALSGVGRRSIQISATPASTSPSLNEDISTGSVSTSRSTPDANFEVLGSPYSLLSVSLSPSQHLHTRRGTLVGVSGNVGNAKSSLWLLGPFRRTVLGIPFLYQRITSTSPLSVLVSTKSPITSLSVVHLDGRVDWMIAQRQALLAWTGNTLSISPTLNTGMSLAHWGNSQITGRGLVALSGLGQIYQVTLKAGEDYVVHPSNVLAYTVMQHPPSPYRFEVSSLPLQVPNVRSWIADTGLFRGITDSTAAKFLVNSTYLARKLLADITYKLRTWFRKYVWGDRLFLRFQGPTTILIQSRGSRLSDVLTTRDVNEIAETPPGAVEAAIELRTRQESSKSASTTVGVDPARHTAAIPTKLSYATVGRDKKVDFKDS
ncbi:hypothetical protein EV356DRAFT_470128 [Viridothelium virens]|uniref:Altered inheritance of mitochondria protein 24, mitochondrial n=1 Tax=Viridothelium virens TaxID=1048519 RepID=A0A6A6H2N1_VIRVR|nr:hypothetical protein EV356DRAFT_470128 [Viridothelium virens]